MFYVVGSGPSGVAAARALLDGGAEVTLLDVGNECEPERLLAARQLAAEEPDSWTEAALASIRPAVPDDGKIPLKLCYGSTFPYGVSEMSALAQNGTKCFLSLARGGLSNVWGAAVLPNHERDLLDWPFSLSDLEPHYRAVANLMPLAGEEDELAGQFPFHRTPQRSLRSSHLAASLLGRMRARSAQLHAAGVIFGKSRLAVRSEPSEGRGGCQYTGLCLSGCPHFAIWSSSEVLEDLMRHKRFRYEPGVMIERIRTTNGSTQVQLTGIRTADRSVVTFVGERAVLACGPIATARIVFDSLGNYEDVATLQFQPYFLLPLVALRAAAKPDRERLHTLAQLFLEISDPALSRHTVHLQVYTFNEFIARRVALATRWLGPFRTVAQRPFLGRLAVIQGYLHSAEGSGIRIQARPGRLGRAELTLSGRVTDVTRATINRVARKLVRHGLDIGALPLAPLIEIGSPGDGNHVGGTFPHSSRPSRLQTDLLGQLPQLPGVHIVDSSVLPSLGATTFTYTTMANAHRIGQALARLQS